MEIIFFVNLAVSLVMALGLWLVWRHDPEQRFALNMGWATLANGLSGIAFLLWKSPQWHALGSVLLPMAVGVIFANVYAGVSHLGGWPPKRRSTIALGALMALAYLVLIELAKYGLVGYFNSAAWFLAGGIATRVLWHKGWLARWVGFLLLLTGVNAGFLIAYGTEGMVPLYSTGIVLRVALGIVLMAAAMVRTQDKAMQAKARYKALSQSAALGIVVLTTDKVLYANPAAARIGGYASVDALVADGIFALVPEAQRALASETLRQLLVGELAQHHVLLASCNKQGQPLHLDLTAWRIQWDGYYAVQIVASDDTQKQLAAQALNKLQEQYEQQRVEFAERSKQALLKANAELEQRVAERTRALEEASQAKSQFLASMSHEIRTPMNVVLGLLELLLATQQSAVQADYSTKAKRAAKSLLGLLNDLLDFSKIDAGKMELELLPFSMERLLRDLSHMVPTMVGSKPVEVLFDIDPTLPDTLVGDSLRLQQVMLNLLSNAIKFTAQGEVVVQLQVCHRTTEEATLRISVRDTGIGIAPENQQHIFEVFAQAESSITRRFGGSGLGLSICKQLLTLMGGDLRLQSTPGHGSCFYFELTLPLASGFDANANQIQEPTASHERYVLVVDDNDAARKLTVTMGQGLGWKVDAVESGALALDKVQALVAAGQALYDAILVDWKMQPLDGWETLRRVRALYPADHMPACVMASANGREVLRRRSQQDQQLLSAFVTKPVTASMLGEAVESACQGQANIRTGPRQKAPKGLRLNGVRVLLVEDNPLNQLVARELLSAEGAQVTTADNGALGVASLADKPTAFDVVLMDMQMPVMDGCTAAREIRTTLKLDSLPVIAMTANTMQSDKDACLAAGMNDHVGKPFDIGYLVEVLRRHCGLQALRLDGAVAGPHPASDTPTDSDLDVEGAIAALGGDRDLYAQVVRAFLDELAGLHAELTELLEAGDRASAKRTLHTLKGTAAAVGSMALSRVARAAEQVLGQEASHVADALMLSTLQEAAQTAQRQLAGLAAVE